MWNLVGVAACSQPICDLFVRPRDLSICPLSNKPDFGVSPFHWCSHLAKPRPRTAPVTPDTFTLAVDLPRVVEGLRSTRWTRLQRHELSGVWWERAAAQSTIINMSMITSCCARLVHRTSSNLLAF